MKSETKIKAVLQILWSTRDKNGNIYYAFVYTDAFTLKQVSGKIGESSKNSILLGISRIVGNDFFLYETEMPKRKFQKRTKDMDFSGHNEELVESFIRKELNV